MKVSDLTPSIFANYLKDDEEEETTLQIYLDSAISYVKNYTSLTDEEMDKSSEISIAVLAVASSMFDNRETIVAGSANSVNRTIDTILGMHSKNLL